MKLRQTDPGSLIVFQGKIYIPRGPNCQYFFPQEMFVFKTKIDLNSDISQETLKSQKALPTFTQNSFTVILI